MTAYIDKMGENVRDQVLNALLKTNAINEGASLLLSVKLHNGGSPSTVNLYPSQSTTKRATIQTQTLELI